MTTPTAALPQRSTVIVVSGERCCVATSDPKLERLVALELGNTGVDVVTADATTSNERERRIELGVIAEERGARAALRLVREAGEVVAELWMRRDQPGRALFWRLGVDKQHANEAPSLIALRVSELMRSQLNDEAADDRGSAIVESLTPPPSAPYDTHRETPLVIYGGAAVLGARDGPGAWPAVLLGAQLRLFTNVRVSAEVNTTVADRHVTAGADSAGIGTSALRLWVTYLPWRWSWIVPELSLGCGAFWLRSHGDASTDLTPRSDSLWTAYVGAGLGAAVPVSKRVEAVISGRVGAIRPQASVVFANARQSAFRSPVWETSLAVRVQVWP